MKLAFAVFEKILFIAIPVATSSTIAALPGYAATFASSESGLSLIQFTAPVNAFTSTNADTLAVSDGSGTVTANASADAELSPEKGSTASISDAEGTGLGYRGEAVSIASLKGVFELGQNSVVSFDFFANLRTAIDNSNAESAFAATEVAYNLVDDSTSELIDTFSLLMALDSPGTFKILNLNASQNFKTSFNFVPGGNGLASVAQLKGSYLRTFDRPIKLELQAFNANAVTVQAVPTPAMLPGLLITSVWLPFVKRKRERAQQLATQEIEA